VASDGRLRPDRHHEINNAGYAEVAPLEEITLESWNRVLAVTLTGTFLGMKYCLPVMRRQGSAPSSTPPRSPARGRLWALLLQRRQRA